MKRKLLLQPLKKNKKGQGDVMPLVIFIGLLFLVLIVGFLMVVGSSVINWVLDVAVPPLTNLGTTGGVNLTQTAELTLIPLNNIIQQFTWATGVLYVMMLSTTQ